MENNKIFPCGTIVYVGNKLCEVIDHIYLVWYIEHLPIVYVLFDGKNQTHALHSELRLASSSDTEAWKVLYSKPKKSSSKRQKY